MSIHRAFSSHTCVFTARHVVGAEADDEPPPAHVHLREGGPPEPHRAPAHQEAQGALRRIMEQYAETCRFILSCNYSSKIIEPIQSRCAVFRFRPLADADVNAQVHHVAKAEGVTLAEDAGEALTRISQGDLRKALTGLQVAAALDMNISRDLIYETSATAPPEALHQFLMACRDDGFHAARRRLRELLDKYGLAGTDFVNQLHRELYTADFLSEEAKLDMTEWMAEVDYRLVEGGGEQIQLDALTARLVTHLRA